MSNRPAQVLMRWTGEVFKPLERFKRQCEENYALDAIYGIDAINQRSRESHNEYWALLQRGWENLPPPYDTEFADRYQLRAFALIKCGYADKEQMPCVSNAQALEFVRFMKPGKDYSIVEVTGRVVTRYTPKSQEFRAMGRKDFQQSKEDVLAYVSSLIGVDVRELKAAPKAA